MIRLITESSQTVVVISTDYRYTVVCLSGGEEEKYSNKRMSLKTVQRHAPTILGPHPLQSEEEEVEEIWMEMVTTAFCRLSARSPFRLMLLRSRNRIPVGSWCNNGKLKLDEQRQT
jgi:hypothetical protein